MEMQKYIVVLFFFLHAVYTKKEEENTEEKKPRHPKLVEYSKNAHKRPTKCQVCRVLAQELSIEVNKTKDVKESLWLTNRLDGEEKIDERNGKKIDYKTSELRLMDILEKVCKNVEQYRSIAGPEFPYLKGVKSMFRQQLEDMMGTSGLKLKLDAPESMVEDPTFEISRMYFQCNQMIEEYEDDIMDWYIHKPKDDPLEFLCAERVLNPKQHDCLTASTDIPDFAEKPASVDNNGEKVDFHSGKKMEL